MKNEYDFYAYGIKVARDTKMNIEKLKAEIEQRYGKKARDDFESGYETSFQDTISNAKLHIEENNAEYNAMMVDRKVEETMKEEEMKRYGAF